MSVQVILREPVDYLGRRGDIVKVANGYARNYSPAAPVGIAGDRGQPAPGRS